MKIIPYEESVVLKNEGKDIDKPFRISIKPLPFPKEMKAKALTSYLPFEYVTPSKLRKLQDTAKSVACSFNSLYITNNDFSTI